VIDAKYHLHTLIPKVYNANRAFSGVRLESVIELMQQFTPPRKDISIYLSYAWFEEAAQVSLIFP
jgi:hypothetical protein